MNNPPYSSQPQPVKPISNPLQQTNQPTTQTTINQQTTNTQQTNQQTTQTQSLSYIEISANSVQNSIPIINIGNNASNYIGVPVVLTIKNPFPNPPNSSQSPSYNPSRVILPPNTRFENGIAIVKSYADVKYPDSPDIEDELKFLPNIINNNDVYNITFNRVEIIVHENKTNGKITTLPYEIVNGLIMTEYHYNNHEIM
jgi:hypothetical protein